MKPRALGLDIGSTRLKLAVVFENGSLELLAERAFPDYSGNHLQCEVDPLSLRDRIEALFEKAESLAPHIPLGVSVQRSSFLLWERDTGKPLTKLWSWQDRRAQPFCDQYRNWEPWLWEKTGLPFSPHYAGPKLAYLLADQPWLAGLARKGNCCFGTLDTYLAWCWSKGRVFQTDPSMAARTQLLDLESGEWSQEILKRFGIPNAMLPKVASFCETELLAPGGFPVATIQADQTLAAIPLFTTYPNACVLNAGTGTFLLKKANTRAPDGYLTARTEPGSLNQQTLFWEASINAGAGLWKQCKPYLLAVPNQPAGYFAAPESHGWATPYWRGDLGQICTDKDGHQERAVACMEGYAFRILQVANGLFSETEPQPFILGGGLVNHPIWQQILANYLPFELFQLRNAQLSLWGAAWMADGQRLSFRPSLKAFPEKTQGFNANRFQKWLSWMESVVKSDER